MLGGVLGAGIVVAGGAGVGAGGAGAGAGAGEGAGTLVGGGACEGSGFGTCGGVGDGEGGVEVSDEVGVVGLAGGGPDGIVEIGGTRSIGGGFVSGISVSRVGSEGPIAVDSPRWRVSVGSVAGRCCCLEHASPSPPATSSEPTSAAIVESLFIVPSEAAKRVPHDE